MGMEQKVTFSGECHSLWENMAGLLSEQGFPVQVRMIDGELAFPDEAPPENWRELRVGTPQGMVTLRREEDGIAIVTWGNADAGLRLAWNALTWACGTVCEGHIMTDRGPATPKEFSQTVPLPEGWKLGR
jgi:hypothetical protein